MSSPSTLTFGALLRQLRRRAQMTQGDLAAAVGYSVSFISSLEQNTRRPDVHRVLQHFVPALELQAAPHLAAQLLELAAAASGDRSATTLTLTHARRIVITETITEAPTNLPAPPTPLVGREQTVKLLCDRLLAHSGRLLTLVGSPGVGKTRLALEVATTLQAFHPDGTYFVALAPVNTPALVASAIVAALGLLESNAHSPQSRLLAFLRHKELLLLLDNFEQVITAAPLVAELLTGCPQLRVLATSRERLHLRAEQRFLVPPLDLAAACTLFVQRAQAVDLAFTVTAQNQATIERICQALDCLPLALELSAAQLAFFTPQTLLDRFHQQGLDVIEDGPRDLPDRQRSLRAVFDHAWRLLNAAEQQLLAQLSIFRGGFTHQAVEQVTATSVQLLLSLLLKSLIRRHLLERYNLHELIRQYAAEQLAQMTTIREVARHRHSAFYCSLLGEQQARLHGPEQQAALTHIALEIDNVRTAWAWAVQQQQIDQLGQAIHSLGLFYEWRNYYQEGEAAFRNAVEQLQHVAQPSPHLQQVLAHALTWQAAFTRLSGRLAEAEQLLQQSLQGLATITDDTVDTRRQSAFTFLQLGQLCEAQVAVAAGTAHYQQAFALYQVLADDWGKATALLGLGEIFYRTGNYTQARQHYEASLAHFQRVGDRRGSATALERVGCVLRDQGQLAAAEPLIAEAAALYEASGDRAKIARGQILLGGLAMYEGNFRGAYPMVKKSIDLFDELGLPAPRISLGIIHLELGEYRAARPQLEAYIAQSRNTGNQSALAFSLGILACLANIETNYREAEQLATESAAICQATQQAERWMIATGHLGYAARGLGKPVLAQQHFITVLAWSVANQGAVPLFFGMAGLALLLADQGEIERAVELYTTLADLPMVATSQSRWDLVGKHIAAAAVTLPPLVVAAAQARGKAGDVWAAATALLADRNRHP